MALFVGGPADGWRLEVESGVKRINIPISSDQPDLGSRGIPTFTYKQECILLGTEEYCIYIPTHWDADQLVQALIMNYRRDNKKARLNYIHNAESTIYDERNH